MEDLVTKIKSKWNEFLVHCYVKDVQSRYFDSCMSSVDEATAVVQVDFSENFQTVTQDANQASYYTYEQVVIFTCCIWQRGGNQSICLVTDNSKCYKKYSPMVQLANSNRGFCSAI